MIIYFLRKTGEIVGTQGGRIHQPEELSMYIGDPKDVDRIIIEWKATKFVEGDDGKLTAVEWEPNCPKDMIPLVEAFEADPMKMHLEYKINPANKRFFKKKKEEIEQAKIMQQGEEQRKEQHLARKKEMMQVVGDKTKPLEDRFNALVDVLNIQARL